MIRVNSYFPANFLLRNHYVRILFLLPDFPFPASTGGRLKVFNILKYLSENHKCDILSFGKVNQKLVENFLSELPNVNIIKIIPLPVGYISKFLKLIKILFFIPPSFSNYNSADFESAIRGSLESTVYDIIHYDINIHG